MSLFTELRRRNVFRVGIAYGVVAWLVLQVADLMIDNIGAPDWLFGSILLVLGIGFPVVLVFAWAFELTPEGIKRDGEVDRSASDARQASRKLDLVIIGVLAVALAYFIYESRLAPQRPEADQARADPQSVPGRQGAGEQARAESRSVAVLPFVNMSSDPEQEYFSDGMTEELINAVVKIPGISVPARTSVFGYKGHQGDIREVGLALGVAYLLEGSIRSQGDQVRVTAQLIKVDDGFHLWSETYDRQLKNIFAVQEEIASAIARQVLGELGSGVATVPNQTRNMEAYDLYLQGRAALRVRDDTSIDLLRRATEADPGFAPAWAALAIAYQSTNDDQWMAVQMADRALALDPGNVDALDAKGSALRSRGRWQEAESYFDQALGIDPNSAELLEDYAEFLNKVGRTEEALEVTRRGVQLDPLLVPLVVAHIESLLTNGLRQEAYQLALDNLDGAFASVWIMGLIPLWRDPGILEQGLSIPPITARPPNLPRSAWEGFDWFAELLQRGAGPNMSEADIERLKALYSPDVTAEDYDSIGFLVRNLLITAGEVEHVLDSDLAVFDLEDVIPTHEWLWTPFYSELRQHPRFHEYLERANLVAYWDATEWPSWCWREVDGAIRCR